MTISTIICDTNFIIQSYDDNTCDLLKCDNKTLCNKCITTLMSSFIAELHEQYFDKLRNASIEERKSYAFRIARGMTNASTFVVYDMDKKPILCTIKVSLSDDLSSVVCIEKQKDNLTSIPAIDTNKNRSVRTLHDPFRAETYDNVVCVMMDVSNSTNFTNQNDPIRTAKMYYDIYNIVKYEVLQYYPYIYIHELLGDSIFLIVNAPFMVKNKCKCSSSKIAIDISLHLQKEIDNLLKTIEIEEKMYLRVGIAQGSIAVGMFDGRNLRVFGSTINLSQRLETLCDEGSIYVSHDIITIESEQDYDLKHHMSDIKGFGTMEYLSILNNK